MIIDIYTQYTSVNNYKDKSGSLKLIKFLSFSFFFFFFFFWGGGVGGNFTNPDTKLLPKHIANTSMQ